MRRWEIGQYTLTQLVNALDRSEPASRRDPTIPLRSLDDLDELFLKG